MTRVVLKDVQKAFEGNTVVESVNIDIEDGEFVILLGPSGCGKTTTLRMIAGLETTTSGSISIGDRDVTNVHAKDRDIAMVFQSYALYPHLTVEENLAFALKLRKTDPFEIARRISDVAESLEITSLLKRKPKTLSGGQQQRVALGRAMVRNPQVYLFDEPLSNLDARLRVSMRSTLIKLHRRLRATMIYVTHDQVEAMTMGDKIVVMNGGKVQQIGTPLEIYDNPVNAYVAGFIGSPAMNLARGCVQQVAGSGRFTAGEGFSLDIPKGHPAETLSDAILGIRPEHLLTESFPGASSLRVTVDAVEQLGAETLSIAHAGDVDLTVRTRRQDGAAAPGSEINVYFSMENVFAFDGVTQSRVL